jgi:trimeric autotransporter adhesin
MTRHGARDSRTRKAATRSFAVPNSSRSPPLQKAGPAPLSATDSTASSASATSSASSSASRSPALNALRRAGSLSTIESRLPSRLTSTGEAGGWRWRGAPRPASQRANSGPPSSSEYAAASAARPSAVPRTAVCRSSCPPAIAARGECSTAARSRAIAPGRSGAPGMSPTGTTARSPRPALGPARVRVVAAISGFRPGVGGPASTPAVTGSAPATRLAARPTISGGASRHGSRETTTSGLPGTPSGERSSASREVSRASSAVKSLTRCASLRSPSQRASGDSRFRSE